MTDKNSPLFTVLIASLLLISCQSMNVAAGSRDPISLVRNSALTGHNSTTVGKAFEGTFQDPKWSTFETPKGQTIVEFNGTITNKAMEGVSGSSTVVVPQPVVPVKFQFLLSSDKRSFELAAFDHKAFRRWDMTPGHNSVVDAPDDDVLNFVYR